MSVRPVTFPLYAVVFSEDGPLCACGDPECLKNPRNAGKHPRVAAWSSLRETVQAQPGEGIGVLCGGVSGLVVIDVDRDDAELPGELPATLTVRTGRGHHYYYEVPKGTSVRTRHGDGWDLQGDGAFVVGPGSMHRSGKTYEVVDPSVPVAPAPEWILTYSPPKSYAAHAPVERTPGAVPTQSELTALAIEIAGEAPAVQGERGSDTTWNFLQKYLIIRHWDLASIRGLLDAWNATCVPPWEPEEWQRKIDEVLTKSTLPEGAHCSEDFDARMRAASAWRDERSSTAKGLRTTNSFERGDHAEIAEYLIRGRELVTAEGSIWEYDPELGVWRSDGLEQSLQRRIAGLAGNLVGEERKLRINHSDVEGVTKLIRLLTGDPSFFATARQGVACQSGFVTADGRVECHSKENRARAHLPLTFDPVARSAPWETFLNDLFLGDGDAPEKIACLQEFFGGALFGLSTRFDRCIVAIGEKGGNGKSTTAQILKALFPPTQVKAVPPRRWEHSFTLAGFVGALLNIVGELPASGILDSQHFKDMIAGDMLEAEHKHKPTFTFEPIAAHYFACNKLPATNDLSGGFWRRFIIVEFNRSFEGDPAKQTDIAEKILATERPAILAWLVEGARRLLAQDGYTYPRSHTRALREWQTGADTVKLWVEDVPPCEKARLEARPTYSTYARWAVEGGYKPVAEKSFKARFGELGYKWDRDRKGAFYTPPHTGPALKLVA